MSRWIGPLLFVVLMSATFGLRALALQRSVRLIEGEDAARARIGQLLQASERSRKSGLVHPGLLGLGQASRGLLPMKKESTPDRSYAHDEVYVYGLHTTTRRSETGAPVRGFILRAWPREFGVTGNLEYLFQDGRLYESRNVIGRSGTEVGFPPSFPDNSLQQPGNPWRPLPLGPAHR